MNNFDDIPFEQNDSFSSESNDSMDSIPFEEIPSNTESNVETLIDDNNIIVLDERIKDIKPEEKATEPTLDSNNILILDPRIKDITPKNSKISFKKPTIIIPVIAFIFVSILGMYLFVSNSRADTVDLIRIEENDKYGYIDTEGTVITRAKYIYGTDYYKGHAIVKNENNLYGVLNSKGVLEVPFGNYYYIGLFGNRYIASKQTKNGLKQALLDGFLDEKTSFKYDTISYAKNGIYLYTRDNTMGILNKEGKEIFSFNVDEIDNKNIDIEISQVPEDTPLNNRYAKVKLNDSYAIINIGTGDKVFGYTLDNIEVLKNNVFYIKSESADSNNTYIVINNNKIKLKTSKYLRVRVDDLDSNIAIAINNNSTTSYINLDNKEEINQNENNKYSYGDGIVLERTHDFSSNKDVYNIISNKGKIGSFDTYIPVTSEFYNKYLNVKLYDSKYNYINKKGELVNNVAYDTTSEFNKDGYAIVSNNDSYGIINSNGKEVVKLSFNSIIFLDEDISNILSKNYKKKLFLYQNENDKYGIINSNGKTEVNAIYDDVEYITDKYPIIKVKYGSDELLYNLSINKELPIKIDTRDITVKGNYIVVGNAYYNYSGKLIYGN